jgi:tRNA/rRNA methyltransferase
LPLPSELDRISVVLVNTRNPLNIGAAARAMSNFGFLDLRLVKPYEASFREARSAVGASEVLAKAQEYASVAEAVGDCVLVVGTTAADRRELQHSLYFPDRAAKLIRKRMHNGRVALLFGSEKRGLSNKDLSHCHFLLRIPAREEHGSMNLGQAVAVCLYELVREPSTKGIAKRADKRYEDIEPATSAVLERITDVLLEALLASGYLKERSSAVAEEKVRRMVRRLKLSAADAEILLGMLRQMTWKMGKNG